MLSVTNVTGFCKTKITLPSEYKLLVRRTNRSTALRCLWIIGSYLKGTSCDDPNMFFLRAAFPKSSIKPLLCSLCLYIFMLEFWDLRFRCVAIHLLTCRGRQWAVVVCIRYNKKTLNPQPIRSTLCLHYVWIGGTMFGDVKSAVYCLFLVWLKIQGLKLARVKSMHAFDFGESVELKAFKGIWILVSSKGDSKVQPSLNLA